ncbi:MAG: hypothetical protein IKA58_00105, partial [Clostridia bacterium]|nr:hypothetical protein [Clostridia bacterium]
MEKVYVCFGVLTQCNQFFIAEKGANRHSNSFPLCGAGFVWVLFIYTQPAALLRYLRLAAKTINGNHYS